MYASIKTTDFNAIRLRLASPDVIRSWSHGEVTRPETINYRTQKPERDGLFCERIFGPSKDWECYCGKYKKIRYKGIVCDKCGVEVTRTLVRRERMGHIELAAAVAHIWFLRGLPSKVATLLDLSVQSVEKVVYFASFVVTEVDDAARKATREEIEREYKTKSKSIQEEAQRAVSATAADALAERSRIEKLKGERLAELEAAFATAVRELESLKPLEIISEVIYQDYSLRYGHIFEAATGAEAIRRLLARLDITAEIAKLTKDFNIVTGPKRDRLMRRMKLLQSFAVNHLRPEWMILEVLPVIPPDLRPMVPLDGGRFATSDLNDLYRRVINRNNRLKQLVELNAPEVICRNEKRMLQEAVDALIDNSARAGKTVMASTGQKRTLKSLADILKGKQGRFRQNLLGKRTDYSGRSVIVVGPQLKLHQCGIPKRMALELYKPFIMGQLISRGLVHNVRSAARFIESGRSEVWDILEGIVRDSSVLLNRAPTLHRLSIQAFQPVLIEGKAIQIHPLVCPAFNADFDGDQMAVHLPLTEEAKREARELMLSTKNLLKPATGDPIAAPTKDIVWGCYYMTSELPNPDHPTPKHFPTSSEAFTAYQLGLVTLHEPIVLGVSPKFESGVAAKSKKRSLKERVRLETTVGRVLLNGLFPKAMPFVNKLLDKRGLDDIVRQTLEQEGPQACAVLLDDIKAMALEYLTVSGWSWGIGDLPSLPNKHAVISEAQAAVNETHEQYEEGLLTAKERKSKVVQIWTDAKNRIVKHVREVLDPHGSVFSMIESGARGSWAQLTQIIGMKGLVTNPAGEIIELPVKASFQEGFDVLEYFISTHGARKGLSDTALRTANAGYLTRRLVDVAQDVVVLAHDCTDTSGLVLRRKEYEAIGKDFSEGMKGRVLAETIHDAKTGKEIATAGALVNPLTARAIADAGVEEVRIRSVLGCKMRKGVCQLCYGYDLGYNSLVELGTAVGIVAAQSIGEPGTQLTMRTFHTGGVVGLDITQGLPRVEELFEVRTPKKRAFLAPIAGTVSIKEEEAPLGGTVRTVVIRGVAEFRDVYELPSSPGSGEAQPSETAKSSRKKTKKKDTAGRGLEVADEVAESTVLFAATDGSTITAKRAGKVTEISPHEIVVSGHVAAEQELQIPHGYQIWVAEGASVTKGQVLTEGSIDLHELYELRGREAVERYLINEILVIYTSQGQKLNQKHVEVIVRQMFSRFFVKDPKDTALLSGEIVERAEYEDECRRIELAGKKPAVVEELLLGITKVSLTTRSFLSAASFQETARVLINAAVTGKVDPLEGLKENVIIGRLIPVGTGFPGRQWAPPVVGSPAGLEVASTTAKAT